MSRKPEIVGQTKFGQDVVRSQSGQYYIRMSDGNPLNLTNEQYEAAVESGNIRTVQIR
jgi:hypothetical protein